MVRVNPSLPAPQAAPRKDKAVAREVKRGCVVGSGDTCDVRGKWVGNEVDEGDWASE